MPGRSHRNRRPGQRPSQSRRRGPQQHSQNSSECKLGQCFRSGRPRTESTDHQRTIHGEFCRESPTTSENGLDEQAEGDTLSTPPEHPLNRKSRTRKRWQLDHRELARTPPDRSNSSAAQRIRNGTNQDLQADFTFEQIDAQGNGIAGTAQGLPLITPWDSKVLDIQPTFQGSGGYGKFIALEDVETGMRFELHHLDSVGEFSIGQVIPGGTTIGTQGASGNQRYDFATHVDIVGTPESVEDFVRSNQSGKFRTQEKKDGA